MSLTSLILMAMTSGAIGVAFAAVSPIVGAFQDIIPWDKWTSNLWHCKFCTYYCVVCCCIDFNH